MRYHLQNIQGLLDSKGKISDMRTKGQLLVKNDAKKLYFVLTWQDAVFQEEGWELYARSIQLSPVVTPGWGSRTSDLSQA